MKLFYLRPKERRDELFDREKELEGLHNAVDHGYPIIALLGIGRIGKTSILKAFINEVDGIYLDVRGIFKTTDLEARISDALGGFDK